MYRLAVTLALLLPACTDSATTSPEPTENARYQQLINGAPDLQTCEDAQTGINCLHTLLLCTNTGLTVMMTDIPDLGHWHVDDDHLVADMSSPSDVPMHFSLHIAGDSIESETLAGEHPWTLVDVPADTLDAECAGF